MKSSFAILFFCLFLGTNIFAESLLPTCSMQLLCNQLKVEDNLFLISRHENSKGTNIQQIFTENQASVLKLLAQKKRSIPAAEFAKMVKAITSVTLGSFDEPAIKKIFPAACDRPNAIYIPAMHRVFVCPSIVNFPDLTLQQILAHELGHVIQKMQNYVPCFDKYPQTQLNEVFADWVASKVLANKLTSEKNPEVAEKQAFESQLLFLSIACGNTQKIKHDWAHTHPNLQNRIENIFLSQPAFQKALRCQSKSTPSCG